MDLESELQRVLRTHDRPVPVPDPVPAVHAGIRRRRRRQRLQVAGSGISVLIVLVGGSALLGEHLAGGQPDQPSHSAVQPVRDPATVPPGYQASDVSFVDEKTGWALGSAPCAAGDCPLLLATTDGGQSWQRRSTPQGAPAAFNQIRFTTSGVGYAFGPGLALTTDGGQHWRVQAVEGSVQELEPSQGSVLRVRDPQGGCPCIGVVVERSDLGGQTWTTTASTNDNLVSTALVRLGKRAVLLERGHTSGGASDARSHLLSTTDDGLTWTARPDPCGPLDTTDEVDATQVSLAPEGRVTALCQHRQSGATSTRISMDSGRTYAKARDLPAGSLLATPEGSIVAAVTADGLAPTTRRLVRSTDDGKTWAVVASQQTPFPDDSRLLRFTTDKLGTWVGGDPRKLVRTTDGGKHWMTLTFG